MLLTSLHYWWEFYQMFSIIDLLISLSISVKKMEYFSATKLLSASRVLHVYNWPVTRTTLLPLSRQLQPYSLSRTSSSGEYDRMVLSAFQYSQFHLRVLFVRMLGECCEMVESTEDIRSDYSYGILSDYTDLHWVSLQQTGITNTNYDTVLLFLLIQIVI